MKTSETNHGRQGDGAPAARRPISDALCALAALLAPFAFLAQYVVNHVSVGNDFLEFYSWKPYLLSMLRSGVFPLWSPTESCGYPFFSTPWTQTFYPLNLLYYAYYRATGQFSAWDYEQFTILALALFGLGLLAWLRSLGLSRTAALTATLCAEMSLKVTELMRFPNAAHAAAWIPWLMLGITLSADGRRRLLGPGVIAVGLALLVTAGYPYTAIHAVFLLVPYVALLLIPGTRAALVTGPGFRFAGKLRFLLRIGLPAALIFVAALPLLLHTRELFSETVDRGAPNLSFAIEGAFTARQALAGWLFPPASMTEGWYYFSAIGGLLIDTFCICCLLRLPGFRARTLTVAILVVWTLVILDFTLGGHSALFLFVWKRAPILNQMRFWSRMTIVLVPLLALLLALAVEELSAALRNARDSRLWSWALVALGAALAIAAFQIPILRRGDFDYYWVHFFKERTYDYAPPRAVYPFTFTRNFNEWRFVAFLGMAAGLLLLLCLAFRWARRRRPVAALVPLFVLGASAAEMEYLSPNQWVCAQTILIREPDFDALGNLRAEFTKPREAWRGGIANALSPQYSVAPFESYDFDRHVRVYGLYLDYNARNWRDHVSAEDRVAVAHFYGLDGEARRLFFSERIDQATIPDYVRDAAAFEKRWSPTVAVASYNGNTLVVEVAATHPGWLTFVDDWDPNWTASVDGRPVSLGRLLGSYKAVAVPEGHHRIAFDYRPALWPRSVPAGSQ